MRSHKIQFSPDQKAVSLHLASPDELPEALQLLDLTLPAAVIVLVGGASGVDESHLPVIDRVTALIAKSARENQAIVLDGGTNTGAMASLGRARAQGGDAFPLIGVAVERLVSIPGDRQRVEKSDPNIAELEPNHTHFILLPGHEWGEESPWIAQLASLFSDHGSSVTVLVNGGEISRNDVENSLKSNRPVLVIQGTGRLADELAADLQKSDLISVIPANDETKILETINQSLRAEANHGRAGFLRRVS